MSWLPDWLLSLLRQLGFLELEKNASIVLLGLDNAGKTTLQNKLVTGKLHAFAPTQRARAEHFSVGHVQFSCWDVGGHVAARRLWRDFMHTSDAIVFMIDANDKKRIAEAKKELQATLKIIQPNVAVAILANKSDKKNAFGVDEISTMLDLGEALQQDTIRIFRTSITKSFGYTEALQWIAKQIQQAKC